MDQGGSEADVGEVSEEVEEEREWSVSIYTTSEEGGEEEEDVYQGKYAGALKSYENIRTALQQGEKWIEIELGEASEGKNSDVELYNLEKMGIRKVMLTENN